MTAKWIAVSFTLPLMYFFAEFLFDPNSVEVVREWAIIHETGERVRSLSPSRLHSKRSIVEAWEKAEADVRHERGNDEKTFEEPQGMWIEW